MKTSGTERRIILIDPDDDAREGLAERLRAQAFIVDTASDAAAGAELALACPPAALVAGLWMPGISGVQLTRLLKAEPATVDVPVILRADEDDPRSRFWAETAGAAALVSKGRIGELTRILSKHAELRPTEAPFFMHLAVGPFDIRDRLAQHLDEALFESVVAAEVRALASTCSFDRLFDAFSQLAARLLPYRWLAIATLSPRRLAIHHHPGAESSAQAEAVRALGLDESIEPLRITDEDASLVVTDGTIVIHDISFGGKIVARIAVAAAGGAGHRGSNALVALFARELGGAIEMALLIERSHRLATTDPLTGLLNRRAFVDAVGVETARSDRAQVCMAVLLFDVDHFKSINDRYGHRIGDAVLEVIGACLPQLARPYDAVARWGGEEFVMLLPATDLEGGRSAAERLRKELEQTAVRRDDGTSVSFTVSVGVAVRRPGESADAAFERADVAMYAAKASGRNRVCLEQAAANQERPTSVTDIREYSAA